MRALSLDDNEKLRLRDLSPVDQLKPVMYIANVDEDGLDNNPYLDAVREYAKKEGSEVVADLCGTGIRDCPTR